MSAASTLQNPRNVATGAATNENFLAGVTRALQKSGQVKVEQGPAMPCQSLRRQKTFPPRITRAIYCQKQETRLSPFIAHKGDNWPNVGFFTVLPTAKMYRVFKLVKRNARAAVGPCRPISLITHLHTYLPRNAGTKI